MPTPNLSKTLKILFNIIIALFLIGEKQQKDLSVSTTNC
ncbi:hypothetical protein L293_1339 [Acinetobacter gyllenbergii CIP 110306 = MTCC 11365]|nr:hypothetical protein L293_1339 [Acinetobacter gyllenbergii CIP 110306 = MTCC 11365]